MNKYFSILIFLSSFFLSSQQNKSDNLDLNINRKGQLYFKLGSEFRITPIPYKSSEISNVGAFTNVDQLHSGPALSYGLEFFINKNFSIGLDHSFRYDTVLYDFDPLNTSFSAQKSQKELLQGFHLYFTKYFKISAKDGEIFVRAGLSSFNGGSEFLLVEPLGLDVEDDPIVTFQTQVNFVNFGTNLAVGYRKKKVSALIGFYFSNGGTFFERDFQIATPFLKLTYDLGKL